MGKSGCVHECGNESGCERAVCECRSTLVELCEEGRVCMCRSMLICVRQHGSGGPPGKIVWGA